MSYTTFTLENGARVEIESDSKAVYITVTLGLESITYCIG